jgi:hypothetical protein
MKNHADISRLVASVALAAALALSAAVAIAAASKGSYAGKSKDEITNSLEQQGYKVRKVESEEGNLEAYAILEGKRYEIYVDPQTGNIVKIKEND